MFTLAISCLTTSNLPWYMDITFQVPMQHCSITSDFTSITSHIHNWVLFLLWLDLFILSWAIPPLISIDLGSSSFSVISFCLFILFMDFSRQKYWSGLPFPSPVNHVLSELSTMTCLSWVTLHGLAHSFTELDKAVVHVISMVCYAQSPSPQNW